MMRQLPLDPALHSETGRLPVRSGSRLRVAVAVGCLAALSGATGCSANLSQLSFRVDKRLAFLSPKSRSLVAEPVNLRWTMRDFTVAGPGSAPAGKRSGYYAIFVDQAPIKPGQTLKSVARGDRACQLDPRCPDAKYLEDRQVYTTTQTSLTLPRVVPLTGTADKTQLHEVVVVLLDTAGRRIGESAWFVTFKLKKRTIG